MQPPSGFGSAPPQPPAASSASQYSDATAGLAYLASGGSKAMPAFSAGAGAPGQVPSASGAGGDQLPYAVLHQLALGGGAAPPALVPPTVSVAGHADSASHLGHTSHGIPPGYSMPLEQPSQIGSWVQSSLNTVSLDTNSIGQLLNAQRQHSKFRDDGHPHHHWQQQQQQRDHSYYDSGSSNSGPAVHIVSTSGGNVDVWGGRAGGHSDAGPPLRPAIKTVRYADEQPQRMAAGGGSPGRGRRRNYVQENDVLALIAELNG